MAPSRILQNTQSPLICTPPYRGASRLCRDASERWGVWGAMSGPPTSLDDHSPSVLVRRRAVLDGHDGVVELLRGLPDAPAVDDEPLALVGELADRRDDGGRPRRPHLAEAAVARGGHHLVDGDRALGHAHAPPAHQG